MSCIDCTKTKAIPLCSETLTLGTIGEATAIVVVTEVATERAKQITGAVNAGVLSIDLTDLGEFLSDDLKYYIQAFEDINSYGTPLDITIDAVAYDCLFLSFNKIVGTDGEIEGATAITIEIDA